MSIPENAISAEGRNLRAAVEAAAAQLGVPVAGVEHKLDMAHFRSAAGTGVGVDSVRIYAWAKDMAAIAPAIDAEAWMNGLLAAMERPGQVKAEVRGSVVSVYVDVGEAGRYLVGRGGTTLRAVQHLMARALSSSHPGIEVRIDVARSEEERPRDDRPRDDRPRDDRPRDDRPRDDRPRDDRPRDDRARDDRPRSDRPPRDDRRSRDDRPRRGDGDEDLRRLARKIANVVLDQGEPQVIRRELNSYDRRIVHMEISEIAGVGSRSVGEGPDRRIEIYLADATENSEA